MALLTPGQEHTIELRRLLTELEFETTSADVNFQPDISKLKGMFANMRSRFELLEKTIMEDLQ